MIVVALSEQNFAGAVAEQLVRELAQPCDCARSCAEALALHPSLIITDEALSGQYEIPMIKVAAPVRLAELIRQIRRQQGSGKEIYSLADGIMFDARMKQLATTSSRASIDLTDKEARLLEALLTAKKQAVSRDALLEQVWGIEAELNTHTLETHIYRLRAKLKECSGNEMIEATEGGYRLAS